MITFILIGCITSVVIFLFKNSTISKKFFSKYRWYIQFEKRQKTITGYLRKKRAVLTLFIGAISLVFIAYTIAFYFDKSIDANSQYNDWSVFFKFLEDRGGLITILFSLYALLSIIVGFYEWNKYEKFSLLFEKSKDKIKILDKFSMKSQSLFNNNSIYKCIVDLLQRCLEETFKESNKEKIVIEMLLCSPLIDSKGRTENPENWGNEFTDLIHHLANSTCKVSLDIYHLPNETICGVNPLKDFTEILVNHISQDPTNLPILFEKVWKSTLTNINRLENLQKVSNTKISLNKTKLTDVPFQIIISKTPLLEEVIVFFAGKSNLESANENQEPMGFHSVDPIVVEAFENIFHDYVSGKSRVPIKPSHTLEIIEKTKKETKEVVLENYLDSQSHDIYKHVNFPKIKIKINTNTFSPAIANSSKFTSRVIQETIKQNDVVLEIGAGTGVQSILSHIVRKHLGNTSPVTHSIEKFKSSYELMIENFKTNQVHEKLTNDKIVGGIHPYNCELDVNGKITELQKIKDNLDGRRITYIIADLPFVDSETTEDLDHAFFDSKHSLHKSLLTFFSMDEIVDENAILLTSFSSLGGTLDIVYFEMLINEAKLNIIKKTTFIEDGIEWTIYLVKREATFESNFWWDELNVK